MMITKTINNINSQHLPMVINNLQISGFKNIQLHNNSVTATGDAERWDKISLPEYVTLG